MYDAEYWEEGRGFKELDSFRHVLLKYRWVKKIPLEEGGGTETWFPPADDLGWTYGISLHAKHHGFWSTSGRCKDEIGDAWPESLDSYLASLQPHACECEAGAEPRSFSFILRNMRSEISSLLRNMLKTEAELR